MGGTRALGNFLGERLKRKEEMNSLDAMVKMAQLKESGYDVEQAPSVLGGVFGGGYRGIRPSATAGQTPEGFVRVGGKMVQDPSYLNPLERRRMSVIGGDSELTAGQRLAKDKATQAIYDTVEQNKVKRQQIGEAETALPNAPAGLMGKMRVMGAKMFNPNDPMLSDWQKIKTIGTDAQLLNTAKTKGAISDKEMELFATAAANDDLISAPRLKPILEKLKMFIAADEASKFGAYQKNYGEDPRSWFGQGASTQPKESGGSVPSVGGSFNGGKVLKVTRVS